LSAVAALVVGIGTDCAEALPRDQVASVVTVPSPAEVADAASAAQAELLWILDAASHPGAATLQALLDSGQEQAVSLPVDARGEPVEAAVGRFSEDEPGVLLEAVEAHRVPLRYSEVHSMLASRDAVLATAPPDPGRFGAYAGIEWTGRLFALRPGVLVPASRIQVAAPERRSAVHALRAARSGGWGIGETLRELQRSVSG
jgi:hypothetical protein